MSGVAEFESVMEVVRNGLVAEAEVRGAAAELVGCCLAVWATDSEPSPEQLVELGEVLAEAPEFAGLMAAWLLGELGALASAGYKSRAGAIAYAMRGLRVSLTVEPKEGR